MIIRSKIVRGKFQNCNWSNRWTELASQERVVWSTYMATLSNARCTTKSTCNLSHVSDARHSDHLQHAIVMCRSHKLVVAFWTPRVRPGRPAEHTSRHTGSSSYLFLHYLALLNILVSVQTSHSVVELSIIGIVFHLILLMHLLSHKKI